jgi:predicted nucleic acid-binding protein
MAIVVDVSIAAKWFIPDDRNRFAGAILDRILVESAYVPALFRWEIQNVLLSAERAGRLTPRDLDDALDSLRDLPILVDPPGERIFSGTEVRLARYYSLTAYDAAYLALAIDRRVALATSDAELCYAARDLGIEVLFE